MNPEVQELARILLAGDQIAATKHVQGVEGPAWQVFERVITPAMQYIGQLWEQNEITVADEHLATATCDFMLSRIYPWQCTEQANGKKVMLLCLEGEEHYIGLKMASVLFVENGWNVRYFGPNMPAEYAIKAVEEWKPEVLAISATITYHLPQLKYYKDKLSALSDRPQMMVGGRLAGMYDLSPYCLEGTLILSDIRTLHDWLLMSEIQEATHVYK